MRDPRDYEIKERRFFWTDYPGLEHRTFDTAEDCFRAIEEACRDSNIALAESLEDRNA